ncbi:MAG: glutamine amidotransferase family protein [Chloroflexi bacterium]|nr:glutamine amidotransferase family protein [Chloroflexota bacterium]
MTMWQKLQNPHREDKVIDACSIFGMMDTSGRRFNGTPVIKAIANMHDRGNGLGGGLAAYGIYPEHRDEYVLHLMYLAPSAKEAVEAFLEGNFFLVHSEPIPTRKTAHIGPAPGLWRYFVRVDHHGDSAIPSEDDYVVDRVMKINLGMEGAFVFSSGKDMGVFKGVGYPEDVADFYRLDEYQGYLWTAHGRFPTNPPGWWGGAHPFTILDWTVVHNGEISSYGINRRYLEMFGYHCTMQTDTEVVAYAVDLLVRRHGHSIEAMADVMAPPLWTEIERQPPAAQDYYRGLRQVYGSLLLNGPFTVIIAHQGEMIGLTDRIRLRPLTAAVKGDMLYLSSEEAAIRLISPELDRAWIPVGGEPIVGRLKTAAQVQALPVMAATPGAQR